MRWVKGKLSGSFFPQVNQESRVHHGNGKATPTHLLAHGDVGRGSFIVALEKFDDMLVFHISGESERLHSHIQRNCTWDVIPHQKFE